MRITALPSASALTSSGPVRIQIWGAAWKSDNLYARILKHGAERLPVERGTVQDQVPCLFQEAIHAIGQLPRNLLHPGFTRLIGDTCDVDATRTDVDDEHDPLSNESEATQDREEIRARNAARPSSIRLLVSCLRSD
jgi:hypothetical protein